MPKTRRFWLKRQRAKEKKADIMLKLTRLQYVFHHSAGEVVSSTELAIDEGFEEHLLTASIAFLIGVEEGDIWAIMNSHKLIMREFNGQRWAGIKDALFVMGLLSGPL